MRTFLTKIFAALALGVAGSLGSALGEFASEAITDRFDPPEPEKRKRRTRR